MIDEKKYFKTIDTKLEKYQKLKLVGCNHGTGQGIGDFYDRKKFYEKMGTWADIFILEQSAYREFHESPFFHNISQIAYHQNKKIYCIDPINERAVGLQKRLEKKFKEVEAIDKMRLMEGNQGQASRARYNTSHPKGSEVNYHNNIKKNWWEISYGIDDWRNVVIATLLEGKISKLDVKNILAIHGGAHTRPIDFYLRNPQLRKQKFQQYSRFNEAGISYIKEFTPRPDMCKKNETCWERNLITLPSIFTKIRWTQ